MSGSITTASVKSFIKSVGGEPKDMRALNDCTCRFEAFGNYTFGFNLAKLNSLDEGAAMESILELLRIGTGDESIGVDEKFTEDKPLPSKKERKKKAKVTEQALDMAGSDDAHKTAVLEDME